jgi:polyisoprenoid-binding protein YceI
MKRGVLRRAVFATCTALSALVTGSPASAQKAEGFRLVIAPQGNEARYRVQEQLVGVNLPNDAVGKTSDISGVIAFDAKGNVIAAESKFVVNVTGLKSDKDRRDGYVQRRLLETDKHPAVTLVPTAVRGLTFPLPTSGKRTFELVGNLTVRGVTRATTWRGEATFEQGQIRGQTATVFTFAEFEMSKPRVPVVLSVEDTIKLEYDFTLIPAGDTN